MNCEEFRALLHQRLDAAETGDVPAEMRDHAGLCNDCRAFLTEMTSVDRLLRQPTTVEVPDALLQSLHAIAADESLTQRKDAWVDDIRRFAALVIPSAAAYAVVQFLSPGVQTWLNVVLTFGGGAFWWSGVSGLRRTALR